MLSGEMDSYLLQHMRFSEKATYDFGQFVYTSMTPAAPGDTKIFPVHFIASKHSDEGREKRSLRDLEKLVPLDVITRLVGL